MPGDAGAHRLAVVEADHYQLHANDVIKPESRLEVN